MREPTLVSILRMFADVPPMSTVSRDGKAIRDKPKPSVSCQRCGTKYSACKGQGRSSKHHRRPAHNRESDRIPTSRATRKHRRSSSKDALIVDVSPPNEMVYNQHRVHTSSRQEPPQHRGGSRSLYDSYPSRAQREGQEAPVRSDYRAQGTAQGGGYAHAEMPRIFEPLGSYGPKQSQVQSRLRAAPDCTPPIHQGPVQHGTMQPNGLANIHTLQVYGGQVNIGYGGGQRWVG
jgi:hypothetical protein